MKDFQGKIAFITGGASGAGFGQVQVFGEAGAKVVIADIRKDVRRQGGGGVFAPRASRRMASSSISPIARPYRKAADEVEQVFWGRRSCCSTPRA